MPYYDVANLVTVTKTNLIHKMPCGYGTLRTTTERICHIVSRRAAQRSQLLQHLTILSSAKCILVTGSLQEYLRGCGVYT
jgi:hypothetical protein